MDELREADVTHREAHQEFVLLEARPWYRQNLGRLYLLWGKWNQDYFGGALVTPYVLFAEPSSPQRLGDYARVSGFGGHGQVRLRPSLLTGSHPSVRGGDQYAEGRFRLVADVFLHETKPSRTRMRTLPSQPWTCRSSSPVAPSPWGERPTT